MIDVKESAIKLKRIIRAPYYCYQMIKIILKKDV